MARAVRTLTIGDVVQVLDEIAPPQLAQSWDNVGLLAGDRSARCKRILLCIDLTPPVLDEAIASNCELIVAYHPPIFRPIARLLADSPDTDAIVHNAIAAGIAIYSPHTALDAAAGGTNDVLAGFCKLTDIEPFEYVQTGPAQSKVVTFVPEADLEKVASALFAAGAGRIGEYEQCSYRVRGQGTFFGTEGANPRVGQRGRLEFVDEVRIEVVAPNARLPEVIAALRASHPYEEPAFDIYPLTVPPQVGIGRVGNLPEGTTLGALARTLARATKSKVASIVGPAGQEVRRAAVCVGAAGRLPFEKPRSRDCEVIVTGEIRHHDALTILRRGVTAIALGHWESERPALSALAARIREALPYAATLISQADVPPFTRV